MEADRGLVEHVEHACQSAAHLGRQPDPLHLTTREAARRPGHVEVFEPHVYEERDPGLEFAEEVACDLPVGLLERHPSEFLLQPA